MTGFKIRKNFLHFFSKNDPLPWGFSMRAFPMRENAPLTLIQGRRIEAKIKTVSFLCNKMDVSGVFLLLFECIPA
jgi:hypothetical protein